MRKILFWVVGRGRWEVGSCSTAPNDLEGWLTELDNAVVPILQVNFSSFVGEFPYQGWFGHRIAGKQFGKWMCSIDRQKRLMWWKMWSCCVG